VRALPRSTRACRSLSRCHIHVMMSGRAQGKQVTWSPFAHAAAYHEWNLDGLVELTWQYLDLLRIYTKPKVPLLERNALNATRAWPNAAVKCSKTREAVHLLSHPVTSASCLSGHVVINRLRCASSVQTSSGLRAATGPAAGLQRAGHHPAQQGHCGGLLQPHPQGTLPREISIDRSSL
jgi:hypothetical protein